MPSFIGIVPPERDKSCWANASIIEESNGDRKHLDAAKPKSTQARPGPVHTDAPRCPAAGSEHFSECAENAGSSQVEAGPDLMDSNADLPRCPDAGSPGSVHPSGSAEDIQTLAGFVCQGLVHVSRIATQNRQEVQTVAILVACIPQHLQRLQAVGRK